MQKIRVVQAKDNSQLEHNHILYPWPSKGQTDTGMRSDRHFVFPAVLSDPTILSSQLDQYFDMLLQPGNFASFPFYKSSLNVLLKIHKYFLSLDPVSECAAYLSVLR
jgi:hypothetical protein